MRSREVWLPVHIDLPGHVKTGRVARHLSIERPHVVGHLVTLWLWAMTNAPTGDLSPFDHFEIAEAAGYKGDATAFVEALVACGKTEAGFLEKTRKGLKIHEVELYLEALLEKRKRRDDDKERKAKQRERERLAALAALEQHPPEPPEEPPSTPAPLVGAIGEGRRQAPERVESAPKGETPMLGVPGDACHSDVTAMSRGRHSDIRGSHTVEESREEERENQEGPSAPPPADAGAPSPPKRSNPKTGAVGAYCDAWRERYGLEPVITAKDAKAVNAALVAIPEHEREAIARAYVADNSPRLVEQKHPLPWLVTDINRLRVQVAKTKPSKPRRVIDESAPAWAREVSRLLGNRERPPLSDEQDDRFSRMTRAWGSWLAGGDPQPSAEEIAVLAEISKLERKIA